jgi:fused signal recognition particle receptor
LSRLSAPYIKQKGMFVTMGFFSKIAEGIRKTKDSMMGKFDSLLKSFTKIDEEFFEELEELLITCDIGVETSLAICGKLREKVKEKGLTDPEDIRGELKDIISDMLGEDRKIDISTKPSVILVIGVNGAGKTTTIGKLAAKYVSDGKKVLVAAADTFRAAAIEQLQIWTERAGADIVKHEEGSDPAAVVFDAVTAAKARGTDVLICDTAGRLHNKKNLMDELKKISRIIHEQAEGCSLETLLVLDATTGQNAVNQAKLFSEVAEITGIVLTKLDGTAKGGIIISIHNELGIPVKLVGVGEKLDDLQEFNAHDFAEALFDTETDFDYNYERLTDEDEAVQEEDAAEPVSDDTSDDTLQEETLPETTISEDISRNEEQSGNIFAENAEIFANEEESTENAEEITENTYEENISEEEKEEIPEKKSIKDGKFGFLFKEITFGKKKKDGENVGEISENKEGEEE